jgi:hypothetical protein
MLLEPWDAGEESLRRGPVGSSFVLGNDSLVVAAGFRGDIDTRSGYHLCRVR